MNTIQSNWEEYKVLIPKDAPKVQFNETERAFYAGAFSILHIMINGLNANVSEDAGVKVIDNLRQECLDFFKLQLGKK